MIKDLKKHLTLLFTVTTGLILTLVVAITYLAQVTQTAQQTYTGFQNQFEDIINKLESSTILSDEWLARMESDHRLIIHIEENAQPLFFSGSWSPKTDRNTLVDMAKGKALEEHIDIKKRPFSYSKRSSSFFSLKGKKGDTYQSVVTVISTESGFCSLVLLLDTTSQTRSKLAYGIFFLLLDILGILALYLVSRYVVGRALKPVEESYQKQTDFVSAASHELRSPLAVIQTSASAILSMPEQSEKMSKIIQQECTRAGQLVKNLLLLASADSGTRKEPLVLVEIDSILLRLFENYQPLCQEKRIHLMLQLPEDMLPEVIGSAEWIYQIISIFLENAIAYGCEQCTGGKQTVLTMEAALKNDTVRVSVIDHGRGIPDDLKSVIFDRFYRADKARNKKEHFGLGLSIALMLSKQMDAQLQVSDTPGGGAVFSLNLPISKKQ